MSNPKALPAILHGWAERRGGGVDEVRDASHPQENSQVRELARANTFRFRLKVSPTARMHERETFALRRATPALGVGRAPRLRASGAERLTLLTAADGRELTQEKPHVPKCLAGLNAVSALTGGEAHDDPYVAARGRRTLFRLMTEVFA